MIKFKSDLRKQLKDERIDEVIKAKLNELEFDLSNPKFILNDKYIKNKNVLFFDLPVVGRINWDYYIEKIMFAPNEIDAVKNGIFDINNNNNYVNVKNISVKNLLKEIIKEEGREGLPHEKENIRQKLYDIKNNLKKINIDLSKFGMKNRNTLKLIKLIYQFENSENINLILLLKNASLENVDNSSLDLYNQHGEKISKFKYEIMKELDVNFIFNSKAKIGDIIHKWTLIIEDLKKYLINSLFWNTTNEFDRISSFIKDIYNKIDLNLNTDYEHNIFETMYFNIIKNENVGREKDILSIQEKMLEEIKTKKNIPDEIYIKKYKEILENIILKENIKSYVEKNLEVVTQLVLMQEIITDYDKNYIKSIVKYIDPLLQIINDGTTCNHDNGLSLTFIISCLQEILISKDTKEKYVAHYFKSDAKPRTLFSILKNQEKFEEIYKILWIKKINVKFYTNLGLYNELKQFSELENIIDKIILKILSLNNLNDINITNKLITDLIQTSLVNNDIAFESANKFADLLNKKTNYKLCIRTPNALNFFKIIYDNSIYFKLIDNISKYINKTIKESIAEVTYSIPLEYNNDKFLLIIRIKNNYKIIDFTYFVKVQDDKVNERLIKLGLNKFIDDNIIQERILQHI